MIPKLYSASETQFSGEGIGRLVDATKCEVTEERNGMYELVLQYPVNGKMFNELQIGRYITATHDESRTPEPFQIYSLERPLEGFITVHAWHISYLLNYIVLEPYMAVGVQAAIAGISTHSINTNPFTFWTDKTSVGPAFYLEYPATVRSILGGTKGSLLDYYGGGEYEFSGWTVKLYQHRGANRGVSIRYGKNLTKLDQQLDGSDVYDSVVPYWSNGETYVCGTQLITRTGATPGKAVPLDVSSYFDEEPTVEDIEAAAQDIIDNSANYTLKENLKIDFVALWQTEEYKQYANLERVKLCDTVNIYYAKMDVNVTAKVIKVVYDSLRERYTSIELGEPTTTLSQQIRREITETVMPSVPTKSMMQGAIEHATELISGGFGGYIKYNYLSDGTPSEMLIMDSPSEATATNIIRLNQNGLGFSTDGGATYANAWTIDGQLVADFITAGVLAGITLRGNTIEGGSITSEGTYPSGVEGTTVIQAGTITSEGQSTGSIIDYYKGIFEASDIDLEWHNSTDPNDVWKTWIEAGGIEISEDDNGNKVGTFINPRELKTGQLTCMNYIICKGDPDDSNRAGLKLSWDGGATTSAAAYTGRATFNNITHASRWIFRILSYGAGSGQILSVGENYTLPIVDADMTADKSYNIWTTKHIPEPPSTNGTYTLKVTVSGGTVTYSWV